jgi:zinc and cadmium transporter
VVLIIGSRVAGFATALIPIAAGGFIYIAASDLVPELKEETRGEHTPALLLAIGAGIALTGLPLLLERF